MQPTPLGLRLRRILLKAFAPHRLSPLTPLYEYPLNMPGRVKVMGWDLTFSDTVSANFMLQLQVLRGYNDFTATRPDPYVLDCGANIGIATLRYKQLYPQARIIAFEPDPNIFQLLRANITHNQLEQVEAVQAAVWKENTTLEFLAVGEQSGHLRLDAEEMTAAPKIQVQARALADYLIEPVDFLKLDIEGAEFEVLPSIQDRLHLIRQMVVEVHHWVDQPARLAEVMQYLADADFKVAIFSGEQKIGLRPVYQRPVGTVTGDQFPVLYCWREEI